MPENTQQELDRLLTFAADMERVCRKRIEELREEKRAMDAEYDAEIDDLEGRLRLVGIGRADPVGSRSKAETGQKVYRLLQETPGDWVSSRDINRRLGITAVLAIVLADYLSDGRVEGIGVSGGTEYRVPMGVASAA